jgi:probable H4MPT-linked C1 transfer pathway protein
MTRSVLGLDIGGANLKAGHSSGATALRAFPLWKNPADLADALRALLAGAPPADVLAVTMTGELCDCYESKRQGVHAILDALEKVAGKTPVRVWRNDGRFVDLSEARATPLSVAAANWLALATFAGRFVPEGPALLVDIGSTTTDIIPLLDGEPVPQARTDPERLRCGELVYTGIRRTPLCAILGGYGAAEVFATTLDIHLVLGAIPEVPEDRDTADGRPATKEAAHARLARMLCADLETSTAEERRKLAERVLLRQVYVIRSSLERVAARLPGPLSAVVLAGSGEPLAQIVLREHATLASVPRISLTQKLGKAQSCAGCAYALAVLASDSTP